MTLDHPRLNTIRQWTGKLLPIGITALLVIVHAATLLSYPAPFVDEGWFGSRAWAFRTTHQAFGDLDRGVFDRFPGYWTYFPWIPTCLQSFTFLASTVPKLAPLRVLSLIAGAGLLFALFQLSRQLGGSLLGWLTVLVVGFSRSFLYSAHLARYDIFVAALGFGAIAISFRTRTVSARRDLFAGLLVSLSFEIHPNGCLFGPVLLLLYFQEMGFSAVRSRRLWAFVGGIFIGLVLYVLLHVVRYPETWLAINRIAGSVTHLPPLLTLQPATIANSFVGTIRLAEYISPLLLPLAGIAIFYLWFAGQRRLLLMVLSLPVLHSLLIQHKLAYYAILFAPGIELTVAFCLLDACRRVWKQNLMTDAARIAACALVLGAMIYAVLPLSTDRSQSYSDVSIKLKQTIRPGESIMGNQVWWFPFYDHPWYSWEQMHYFRTYRPGASLEEAFREFHPDILILDGHLSSFISDHPQGSSYFVQLHLSRTELERILAARGKLRARFDGGNYGQISVIALNWERSGSTSHGGPATPQQ